MSWLWILLWLVPALGQEEPATAVRAKGYGAILAGDVANARDRAIEDALRRAVEQAVGTYIQSETVVQNFMLVKDEILSRARGFVQSYKVLSDGKEDPTTYAVTVEALVKVGDVAEAVEQLIEQAGRPRIMVLIQETVDGEPSEAHRAEDAVVGAFRGKSDRFLLLDPEVVARNIEASRARAALAGDLKAAAAIGRMAGTDLVIVGIAEVRHVRQEVYGTVWEFSQARVSARALWVGTGEIVTTESSAATKTVGAEQQTGVSALQEACSKLVDRMLPKLLEYWRKEAFGAGKAIQMVVRGLPSLSDLGRFENILRYSIRGLKKLRQRSFEGGMAMYDLEALSDGLQIAKELESKAIGPFRVEVITASRNRIEIQVSKEE
ncbi:MAG TPA: hypothetical protein EYP17_03750 [Candidatus Latescibacteria bacterium]|nr:hypothetical protein [Candidatus Latescibacterota bacterium]